MLRRLMEDGRTAVEASPAASATLNVFIKVIVCVAGGTLGWMLARL